MSDVPTTATAYTPPKVWTWKPGHGGQFANINRPIAGPTHEAELPVGRHPLQLYSLGTPNGVKVTVMLEELLALGHTGAEYDAWLIPINTGAQFGSGFVAVNPNSKIPALLDRSPEAQGAQAIRVFESGAILMYLAEKTGRLLPQDAKGRSRVVQWLMFQMGGIGPMMGQANVFFRYFPEKIPAVIDRYQGETRRLFRVLDGHLQHHEFLAGDYSIADIANWAWVRTHRWSGVELDDLPHLRRWRDAIRQRPAVQRGIAQPPSSIEQRLDDPASAQRFVEEARRMVEMGQSLKDAAP